MTPLVSAFADVVGVEGEETELWITRPARNDHLILPVDASGLVLQIVLLRGGERGVGIDAEISRGKLRSANVVSKVLVHPAAVKIGHIRGDPLGQLTVDAHGRLHVRSGMEMRVDGVESLCRIRGRNRGRIDGKCGIGDGGNRLVDSVLVDGLDHIGRARVGAETIGHGEPLIKPAIPRTQHGLRRLLRSPPPNAYANEIRGAQSLLSLMRFCVSQRNP